MLSFWCEVEYLFTSAWNSNFSPVLSIACSCSAEKVFATSALGTSAVTVASVVGEGVRFRWNRVVNRKHQLMPTWSSGEASYNEQQQVRKSHTRWTPRVINRIVFEVGMALLPTWYSVTGVGLLHTVRHFGRSWCLEFRDGSKNSRKLHCSKIRLCNRASIPSTVPLNCKIMGTSG